MSPYLSGEGAQLLRGQVQRERKRRERGVEEREESFGFVRHGPQQLEGCASHHSCVCLETLRMGQTGCSLGDRISVHAALKFMVFPSPVSTSQVLGLHACSTTPVFVLWGLVCLVFKSPTSPLLLWGCCVLKPKESTVAEDPRAQPNLPSPAWSPRSLNQSL